LSATTRILYDLHDLLTIAVLSTASGTFSIERMTSRGWILVVDDQVAFAKHIAEMLEIYGYQTSVAGSAAEALSVFTEKMDALITDFRMADGNGAELIAEIRRRGSRIPAVVMTAYPDAAMEDVCAAAGALAVLPKPIKMGRLLALVLESVVPASA
jgi:CheY-like chemotaxis protein